MNDDSLANLTADSHKTRPHSETGTPRPVWRPRTWGEIVDLSPDSEPTGPASPGLATGPTRQLTLGEIKTQQQEAKAFADAFPEIDSQKFAELNAQAADGEDVEPVHIDELTIDD